MNQRPSPQDQRNLVVAIILSLAIMIGWQWFYEKPRVERLRAEKRVEALKEAPAATTANTAPAALPVPSDIKPRDATVANGARVVIDTPSLAGSINLTGARFDDLELKKYYTTLAHDKTVSLLSPDHTEAPYYVENGWLASDKNLKLPDSSTLWKADHDQLTPAQPVTLSWNNGQGVTFDMKISVDDNYLFTITRTVINHTDKAVSVFPFARIQRPHIPNLATANPNTAVTYRGEHAQFILHEGPLGFFNQKLQQTKYGDLTKDKAAAQEMHSTGGWLGITDKYWLVAMVPDQTAPVTARFVRDGQLVETGSWPFHKVAADQRDFQVDYRAQAVTAPPQGSISDISKLFAGAKVMKLLDAYTKAGIPRLDLAIDYGWFFLITRPLFHFLSWLGHSLGNFGLAIIAFTIIVRMAMYPIVSKSFHSMQKMKIAGPKMKELQAKYKGDPVKLQAEMAAFYKREKVNPVAGCLPLFIQIPVFFSLYKVLFVTIEMRQAPFFGWLKDLSAPDPSNIFTLFGLIPWVPPYNLHMGILPILFGATMALQMQLGMAQTPTMDPTQQQMMKIMPLLMVVIFANFPAGLVFYYVLSNTISIIQQWYMRRHARALLP